MLKDISSLTDEELVQIRQEIENNYNNRRLLDFAIEFADELGIPLASTNKYCINKFIWNIILSCELKERGINW